jgi:hypothetical protein
VYWGLEGLSTLADYRLTNSDDEPGCCDVLCLDQAHNAIERKLFAMKGFHHPGGSQRAFLTGLAHLYNLQRFSFVSTGTNLYV